MAFRWIVAGLAAAGAAAAASAAGLGGVAWDAMVSLGVFAEPLCSDVVVESAGAAMCVRPTSLTVTIIVTVAAVGALTAFMSLQLLKRPAPKRAGDAGVAGG